MPAKKTPQIERLHCNSCQIITKHLLLKTHSHPDDDANEDFYIVTVSEMFECCGCSSVLLRSSLYYDDPVPIITFFPPAASRRLPQWQESLKPHIRGLLVQVYKALQADSLALAMMGARAILDSAIIDTVTDHGTFRKNLQAMKDRGYLSGKNCEYLEVAFDAGSASVHRSHNPDLDQINIAMDIVENLLQSLFVLEKQAKALKVAIPQRPKVESDKAVKAEHASAKPQIH